VVVVRPLERFACALELLDVARADRDDLASGDEATSDIDLAQIEREPPIDVVLVPTRADLEREPIARLAVADGNQRCAARHGAEIDACERRFVDRVLTRELPRKRAPDREAVRRRHEYEHRGERRGAERRAEPRPQT